MPNQTSPSPRWRVLVGLSYAGRDVAAGEIVDDIPEESLPWLIEQGLIAPAAEEDASGEARI